MDPEANLREQNEVASDLLDVLDEAGDAGLSLAELVEVAEMAEKLAELVRAYSVWRKAGGFVMT
jgi:hypothetical protein